jgi:4-diphosphocytidyl-2-C-methyl-D-erythritol kinase
VKLRARAPGKVNLCLFLGEAREDGRHELVTLIESVSLADELELETRVAMSDEVRCPGLEGTNIASRALEALRAQGWDAPWVRVEIAKRIPVAAGMGGGSADAAAVLRMAQRLSPLHAAVIGELAAELGADVPSQLAPGLALGTGAGDDVDRLAALERHAFVILPLPHRLSTADVYEEADRLGLARSWPELTSRLDELASSLSLERRLPASLLVNDLERAAVSLCPQIAGALQAVGEAGAEHALVCGSGPAVAGLYWGADGADRAAVAAGELAHRYPGACSAVPVQSEFGEPLFA